MSTLAIESAAMLTPLGDLAATVAAVEGNTRLAAASALEAGRGRRGGTIDVEPNARRHARLLGKLPALAIDVVGKLSIPPTPRERLGVFVATGDLRAQWDDLAPAMAEQVASAEQSWARGLSRMHPLWMLRYLSNRTQALIAAEFGAVGDGATFAGSASAASALVSASDAIAAGTIDRAIVVALDDTTAAEVVRELAPRRPDLVPGAGIATIVVGPARPELPRVHAVDGVDIEHAEPSRDSIAALRERFTSNDAREVSFVEVTGWLGAASPLVDTILAIHLDVPRVADIIATGSPGQIGVIRLERT